MMSGIAFCSEKPKRKDRTLSQAKMTFCLPAKSLFWVALISTTFVPKVADIGNSSKEFTEIAKGKFL